MFENVSGVRVSKIYKITDKENKLGVPSYFFWFGAGLFWKNPLRSSWVDRPGIPAPLGPRTARCELVRYFSDFIGAGAVRAFQKFCGSGAVRNFESFFGPRTNRLWCVDPWIESAKPKRWSVKVFFWNISTVKKLRRKARIVNMWEDLKTNRFMVTDSVIKFARNHLLAFSPEISVRTFQ